MLLKFHHSKFHACKQPLNFVNSLWIRCFTTASHANAIIEGCENRTFQVCNRQFVISFLSKVTEEHIRLLEALCRICGGNMRKWQSKTGSGVTANKMAVVLQWRSVSCLRRAVSNGNVTPTAIQSLPVSWLRRFLRNKLNVFSLVIKLLLLSSNLAAIYYTG